MVKDTAAIKGLTALILFLKNFFFKGFVLIASTSSVIGILLLLIKDEYYSIIALLAFIIFLMLTLIGVFITLNTYLSKKTSTGCYKFATYISWTTTDGDHITYELHKYIQSKQILLEDHKHNFGWSGTQKPIVTSSQQDLIRIEEAKLEGKSDVAVLKFKKPIKYNDFAIVDIKMELDNSDRMAKTQSSHAVKEDIHLLSFRINLGHLSKNKDAKVIKTLINPEVLVKEKVIDHVRFDSKSRSYSYNLFSPETGYEYTMKWDEPSVVKRREKGDQ